MTRANDRRWTTPRDDRLGLRMIGGGASLAVSVLPNGCVFAIEHRHGGESVLINQLLGSPIDGGPQRLVLRVAGETPVEMVGPGAMSLLAAGPDAFVWSGAAHGVGYSVALMLQPVDPAWLWRVDLRNRSGAPRAIDAVLIQDIGLGPRDFLMNNEAYASQYIDHCIVEHARYGPVVMSRQNLPQHGRHPFVMHGCLDGAAAYATDGKQIFGPRYRDGGGFALPFGASLPNVKLQHEMACAAIQSAPLSLAPGESGAVRFFGLYVPDQAAASGPADLARIDAVAWRDGFALAPAPEAPLRSILQDAPAAEAGPLSEQQIEAAYPHRLLEEWTDGALWSFFTPDARHNRHVVLRNKERIATRRHGAILRSGAALLPDEATLCATAWMHGVFAAQLTIGNTSFHKLFSVSRDAYNITRASGLRILADWGEGWRLLAIPSAFEMGLSDCRWIYALGGRMISVAAMAAGDAPALQWRIAVDGEPCRFLIFGHLTLGEREFDHAGAIALDAAARRFSFRPDPGWLWGQRYPSAVYHLVVSTPDAIEAMGGDELLYADGIFRGGAYAAIRTALTGAFDFAVTGGLTDPAAADALAARFERGVADESMRAPAAAFWRGLTGGLRLDAPALDAVLPWLAHDALIHLTVPHGLEQYTGAAWGTRDVCQGPVEFLLAFEHDAAVKAILRIVFGQQYEATGDWPQWFMLDPYAFIQYRVSHGDIIVWPLKALNDYIEATGDFAFLDEPLPWRRIDTLEPTAHADSVAAHVAALVATARARFVPGTHLIRYGDGDWNDSLQPVDPAMRDRMVSSWTVALLYQQLRRAAEIWRRSRRAGEAMAFDALADSIRADFNRLLMRDGIVAGYAVFSAEGEPPELLLHPRDRRTGLAYSLLPMTRSMIGGLFTPEQTRRHLQLIRDHLLFADGARLMDRPVAYRGGPQAIFRRAESASFFGREIGLMYVHAHLRYAEALAILGDEAAMLEALDVVNPAAVARLAQALPRQRNAFFSSSDAAFFDRASASAEWDKVADGTIGLEAGWRIYSSGPGIFLNLLIRHGLGEQRLWGERLPRRAMRASAAGGTSMNARGRLARR